jgi:hypothetical protein
MMIVIEPRTQARTKIVLGRVSGSIVLAAGHDKTTSMGACIPPGILKFFGFEKQPVVLERKRYCTNLRR